MSLGLTYMVLTDLPGYVFGTYLYGTERLTCMVPGEIKEWEIISYVLGYFGAARGGSEVTR